MTITSPALCLTQYLLNLQMIIIFPCRYCTNLQKLQVYHWIFDTSHTLCPLETHYPPSRPALPLSRRLSTSPSLGWNQSHCTFLFANPLLPYSSSSISPKPLPMSPVQPHLPANMAWPQYSLQSGIPPLSPLVSSLQVCLFELMVPLSQGEFALILQ